MELYLIKNYKNKFKNLSGSQLTDRLIKECLAVKGIYDCEVFRTEKGKPYIKTDGSVGEIFCSVSHSGALFACVFHNDEIGLDIQEVRKANIKKIALRYFTSEEEELVNKGGDANFFTIWTRKEAYAKYTGAGLEEVIKGVSVVSREDVEFIDIMLEKDIFCSCCLKKGE